MRSPIVTDFSGGPPMSSSCDPSVRCRVEEAFPAALRNDVLSVIKAISAVEGSGPFSVLVRGEHLVIPYRVPADAAVLDRPETLPPVQRATPFCTLSRHHDGHIREQALRQLVRSPNDWVVPFVVQLVG